MAFRREKQGGKRIAVLRSLEMKGKLRAGSGEFDDHVIAAGFDRAIRRVNLPAGVVTMLAEKGRAWRRSSGEPIERLTGLRFEEAMRINPLARLADWRETAVAVQVAGSDRLGEEEVWIVRVEGKFSPPLTRYVSKKTGLLLKEDGWVTAKGQGTVSLTVRFADYREVDGVKIPFRLSSESRLTGKQIIQYAEARANPEIRKGTFALPVK
jgi:hypothetical protein